jgi:polyphenol oxidase
MHAARDHKGVTIVPFAGGMALFSDATGLAADLDEGELARAAGAAIAALTGREIPVLHAFQVHGRLSFAYGAEAPLAAGPHLVGNCDALLTAEPWVGLCVRTADCLPVLLCGGGAIAAVHAGWKGLAADILGAVVRRLHVELGVEAGQLAATIGVGVGPCHYPVGPDVPRALAAHRCDVDGWALDGRVDLPRWARGRLQALGLAQSAIHVLPGCTACSPRWHSFRRDGENAGRQWNAIVLTPGWRAESAL